MRLAWVVVLLATAVLTGPLQALIDGVTPQQVVDLLNSIRGNVVPTAAQMVRLTWNDTLAAAAARYAATQCAANFDGQGPQCPDCANWIGEGMYPSATTHGMLDSINDLMGEKAQWSCTQSGTTLSCKCSSYHCYDNWKVILNDGATTVGCGELLASTCGGSYNIYVCAFNGFSSYAHPYTLSATNSSCTQGTCPSAYPSCVNSLCTRRPATQFTTRRTSVTKMRTKRTSVKQLTKRRTSVKQLTKRRTSVKQLTKRRTSVTTLRATLQRANVPSLRKRTSRPATGHVKRRTSTMRPRSRLTTTPRLLANSSGVSTRSLEPVRQGSVRSFVTSLGTGMAVTTPRSKRSSSKGPGADTRSASAPRSPSLFSDVSDTTLFVVGSVAVVCMAALALLIRRRNQQELSARAIPEFINWPTDPLATSSVQSVGQSAFTGDTRPADPPAHDPFNAMPKAVRRLQARGVARDKFNQGARTVSDPSESDA